MKTLKLGHVYKTSMISVICVYNNKEILKNFLLRSLQDQNENYEIILIDNTKNKFKSAPEALNFGASKATGDYLMFVHQDVYLFGCNWLSRAEKMLRSLEDVGIAGVAGATANGKLVGDIVEGNDKAAFPADIRPDRPVRVQTVDELLCIIPKNIFCKLKFDERLIGWHLYCVDYSLAVKSRFDLSPYVLPLRVWHYSRGYVDRNYFESLSMIIDKYYLKRLSTTCGVWYRQKFLNILYLLRMGLFSWVGCILGRNNIGFKPYLLQIRELAKAHWRK